jgi:hypothetical protein
MSLRDAKPSDSAIIREQLPEIEAALARGVTRQQVLEILTKDYGVTLKLRGFDAALLRARKVKGDQPATVTVPTPEQAKVVQAVQAAPVVASGESDKPAQLPVNPGAVGTTKPSIARPDLRKLREQNREQNTVSDDTDPKFR